jgi:hypothetical protein
MEKLLSIEEESALTGKRLGYLINFNVPLIKEGIRRFVNTK